MQAEHCRHTRGAVATEQACFDTFAVVHLDDEGNQAGVWEMGESHRSMGLVKSFMMGKSDKFEVGTDRAELIVRNGQKQLVANRLSFGIRSLAGLDGLELGYRHGDFTEVCIGCLATSQAIDNSEGSHRRSVVTRGPGARRTRAH